MKNRKSITVLVLLIAALSLAAGIVGIFSSGGPGRNIFLSVHQEKVTLYGVGIYQNDSVAAAAQAIAQDVVTVFLGVPLLIVSLYLSRKGGIRSRLLLTGTIGYFLYTYMSYTFLCSYNALFLVYIALMSLGIYAFVLAMLSFDLNELGFSFDRRFPARTVGFCMIALAALIGLMWMGRILPPMVSGTVTPVLEHYTTLVIQAMDLGLVIPAAVLSAVLLMKRKPFGLLLSAVLCMKGVTLLTSLTAMVINQLIAGVKLSAGEVIVFPAANILVLIGVVVFMRRIKVPQKNITGVTAE